MRHIIVRSIMGLVWIVAGIAGMVNGHEKEQERLIKGVQGYVRKFI